MRYPNLKAPARKRIQIDRFRGYEHLPAVSAGAFWDMENLSGELAPHLSVRRRRVPTEEIGGCPADRVLAIGGRGEPVVLDSSGSLWCGGHALPRLLECSVSLEAREEAGDAPVEIADGEAVLSCLPTAGIYLFRYEARTNRWLGDQATGNLPGAALAPTVLRDGMTVALHHSVSLLNKGPRQLVFLGGWVCVFPDGRYVNTGRLRQDQLMEEGTDYGSIAQTNSCSLGGVRFEPCGPDGTPWEVSWSDTAPAGGYWVDSGEESPCLRSWSQSQNAWVETASYVRCAVPGIARHLRAGDGVELFCRFGTNQGGEAELEALWTGSHQLTAAYHDPGSQNRAEGTGDYVVLPGLISGVIEIEMTWHEQSLVTLTRPLPVMDYVVEAGNRLWGCRYDGQINELYGCKLGDFRNWSVFAGLSTDSYRVSRGHEGPYTGAAVLGGCPLFFRADSLEKLFPSAAGDHGVTTLSISGIEPGSAASALVIRDRLYYKGREGIFCYNGTLPVLVSGALGREPYRNAVAGAKGSRYYVSMEDSRGLDNLFVLDTDTGLWYREDRQPFAAAYSQQDRLWLLPERGGPLLQVDGAEDSREVAWYAETGDLVPALCTRRYVTRLQLEAILESGAEMRIFVSYDGGPWLWKGDFMGNSIRARTFPLWPRRCQRLRLRLEGRGGMELLQLSWLTERGSDQG